MTQFLIKTITHDTGEVFHDVVRARENEVFKLVDAESENVAKRLAEYKNISEHFIKLSLRKDSE